MQSIEREEYSLFVWAVGVRSGRRQVCSLLRRRVCCAKNADWDTSGADCQCRQKKGRLEHCRQQFGKRLWKMVQGKDGHDETAQLEVHKAQRAVARLAKERKTRLHSMATRVSGSILPRLLEKCRVSGDSCYPSHLVESQHSQSDLGNGARVRYGALM